MGGSPARRMRRQQERALTAQQYNDLDARLQKVEKGILRIDNVLGNLLRAFGQAGVLRVQEKTH